MTITPVAEAYLRNHLARQREIAKRALATTSTLAQANIDMILLSGMKTPAEVLVAALRDNAQEVEANVDQPVG